LQIDDKKITEPIAISNYLLQNFHSGQFLGQGEDKVFVYQFGLEAEKDWRDKFTKSRVEAITVPIH
jgi:hypothetical protein